ARGELGRAGVEVEPRKMWPTGLPAVGSPGENARSGGVWVLPHASADGSYTVTPTRLGLPAVSGGLAYGQTLSSR
ncbi:hypothetical protein O3Q52_13045, partial [Streptomyces sp. ActVer]|nr:hypothetical protein [Streptomyces sp. ActVer]